MPENTTPSEPNTDPTEHKPLSPEAIRALAEADARRKAATGKPSPAEIGGPKGPDPIRYGDWEKGGIASDF